MNTRRTLAFALAMVGQCALLACGSGGDDLSVSRSGELEIEPADGKVVFDEGEVEAGGVTYRTVVLRNVGVGPLAIAAIRVDYTPPAGAEEPGGPALWLDGVTVDGEPAEAPLSVEPAPGGPDVLVTLGFRRYEDGLPRTATLVVESDTRDAAERSRDIAVETRLGFPVASVNPTLVDFGAVSKGEERTRTVSLTNTGTAPLLVEAVRLDGDPSFSVEIGEVEVSPGSAVMLDPPLEVLPSHVLALSAHYRAEVLSVPAGELRLYTNDPSEPSGLLVELVANQGVPCLVAEPEQVTFGGVFVSAKSERAVTLRNCGSSPVTLAEIALEEGSSPDYALKLDDPPTAEAPWVLEVGAQVQAKVVFTPAKAAQEPGGDPALSLGTLLVRSDAFDPELAVGLSGFGSTVECPLAAIQVVEGESVAPQTVLHLIGEESVGATGPIEAWQWSVEQPSGSVSTFIPGPTFPNPTFQPNVVGIYRFSLDVWDEGGAKSCLAASAEVLVMTEAAIHIELLWETPGDPDETDTGFELGSDVDLHVAHGDKASGPDIDGDGLPDPWFDTTFDVFWFNKHPNWGSFDENIDDNPGLDRDDTDGGGPENFNLSLPENTCFHVGVHYWSDHGFGLALATVRIYIYGNLVFEVPKVTLHPLDMWHVADVCWPSGKVTLVQAPEGGYDIVPSYVHPDFPPPQ